MAKRKKSTPTPPDGATCVSFANTVSAQRRTPTDYPDLLLWLERHDMVGSDERARFTALAAEHPEEAESTLALAERLRHLLSQIFNQVADLGEVSSELLEAFNTCLIETLPKQCLARSPRGLAWNWAPGREDDLTRPLWLVIRSAAALLVSKYSGRIGRCAGKDCDLLFVHLAGGSARRWCSMKTCGNRVKSHRRYHRKSEPRFGRLDKAARMEAAAREREEFQQAAMEEWRSMDVSEQAEDEEK